MTSISAPNLIFKSVQTNGKSEEICTSWDDTSLDSKKKHLLYKTETVRAKKKDDELQNSFSPRNFWLKVETHDPGKFRWIFFFKSPPSTRTLPPTWPFAVPLVVSMKHGSPGETEWPSEYIKSSYHHLPSRLFVYLATWNPKTFLVLIIDTCCMYTTTWTTEHFRTVVQPLRK